MVSSGIKVDICLRRRSSNNNKAEFHPPQCLGSLSALGQGVSRGDELSYQGAPYVYGLCRRPEQWSGALLGCSQHHEGPHSVRPPEKTEPLVRGAQKVAGAKIEPLLSQLSLQS